MVHVEEGTEGTAVVLSCFLEEKKWRMLREAARLAGEAENRRLVSGMPPEAPHLPDRLQDWVNPFQRGRPPAHPHEALTHPQASWTAPFILRDERRLPPFLVTVQLVRAKCSHGWRKT